MEISAIILFCIIIYTLGLGITSYMFGLIDEDGVSIVDFLGIAWFAIFWPVTWFYISVMWVFRKK